MLEDTLERPEYYEKLIYYTEGGIGEEFWLHAQVMLADLAPEEGAKVFARMLTMGMAYVEIFCGDGEDLELVRRCWTEFIRADWKRFLTYLRDEEEPFISFTVGEILSQLVGLGLLPKVEVEQAYIQLINTEVSAKRVESEGYKQMLGGWASDLLDMRATKAIAAMKPLFDRGSVDPTIAGNWDDCQKELSIARNNPVQPLKKYGFLYSEYYEAERKSFEDFDQEEDDPMPWVPPQYAPSAPKIGRNDLCPCGSGRKYKKCCLN